MRKTERWRFLLGPTGGEEANEHAQSLHTIVENYIELQGHPEKLFVRTLIRILKESHVFSRRLSNRDYKDMLSIVLPAYGYSDTLFKRSFFMKMPSPRMH